jgi:hypothetical protein
MNQNRKFSIWLFYRILNRVLREGRIEMRWQETQPGDRRRPRTGGFLVPAMVTFLAFLCVLPAVLMNASAQVAMGTEPFMLTGFVALGLAAPFFSVCAGKALREKSYVGFALYAALAVFFAAVNTIIALGAISGHQDTKRDARASAIQEAGLRHDNQENLRQEQETLRAVAGYDPPDMVQERLTGLRANPLWKRSAECKEVTRTDSFDLCEQISKEGARLAAAMRLVEIRAELNASWKGREEAAPVPEVKDP